MHKKYTFLHGGVFLQAVNYFPHTWVSSAEIELNAEMPSFDSFCSSCNSSHGRTSLVPKGRWEKNSRLGTMLFIQVEPK